MQIPVIRASRHALDLLRSASGGTIHSVYRRTINLQLLPSCPAGRTGEGYAADAATPEGCPQTSDGRNAFSGGLPLLIALQDRDCVLSPLSLCSALSAEQLSALPIEPGQTVGTAPGIIRMTTKKGLIEFTLPAEDAGQISTNPDPASHPVTSSGPDLHLAPHLTPPSASEPKPAAYPALPSIKDLHLMSHLTPPLTSDQISALSIAISLTLPLSPPDSFARILCDGAHDDSLIMHIARSCISDAAALLRTDEPVSAAQTLCRHLIGLGSGLTPAGDDFLCGVLAGLCLCGAFHDPDSHAMLRTHANPAGGPSCAAFLTPAGSSLAANADTSSAASFAVTSSPGSRLSAFALALRNVIPHHLSDTIDISAAFLRCACEGQFSEAIAELAADPPDLSCSTAYCRKIARRFSKIGHTSGFDTLAGISFVLRLTSDVASVP